MSMVHTAAKGHIWVPSPVADGSHVDVHGHGQQRPCGYPQATLSLRAMLM